jgi:hypothetical protein
MNTHLQNCLTTLRRKAESGYTVLVQGIYYSVLLFVFLGLIYDIGNAGYVATIANNAARLAAQDAAKNIDMDAFLNEQEIRLSPDALERAQTLVNGMAGGGVHINSVSISQLAARDVIVVNASAVARMPILGSLFGLGSVNVPVAAYAEPAYGISQEGQ